MAGGTAQSYITPEAFNGAMTEEEGMVTIKLSELDQRFGFIGKLFGDLRSASFRNVSSMGKSRASSKHHKVLGREVGEIPVINMQFIVMQSQIDEVALGSEWTRFWTDPNEG